MVLTKQSAFSFISAPSRAMQDLLQRKKSLHLNPANPDVRFSKHNMPKRIALILMIHGMIYSWTKHSCIRM